MTAIAVRADRVIEVTIEFFDETGFASEQD